MDKATSNHAFCSTDTPTSVSLSCFSWFSWLNTPSAPFVSLRVPSWFIFLPSFRAFRVFRAFRGSNVFLVSIRVHSWFILSHRARPRAPSTRYLLLPIPYEKPFVSIRGSYLSPSFRAFRCIRRAQEWWPTGFAFPGSGLKSLDVPPIPAASNPRGHHYEQTNQIR